MHSSRLTLNLLIAIGITTTWAGVDLEVKEVETVDDKVTVVFEAADSETTIPVHKITENQLTITENGDAIGGLIELESIQADSHAFLLLVDISRSMAEEKLDEQTRLQVATEAAKEFILNKRAQDYIAIIAFAEETTIYSEFTKDIDDLETAINLLLNEVPEEGERYTAMYNAVLKSCNYFDNLREEKVPKAIIMITDGKDNKSRDEDKRYADIRHRVSKEDIEIYCVGIGNQNLDEDALEELSLMSAGKFEVAQMAEDINEFYREILRQFESRITLSYYSVADSGVDRNLIVQHVDGGTELNLDLDPLEEAAIPVWIWFGGAGVLLLIILIVWIVVKRRKKQHSASADHSSPPKVHHSPGIKPLPNSIQGTGPREVRKPNNTKVGGMPMSSSRNNPLDDQNTVLRGDRNSGSIPSRSGHGRGRGQHINQPAKTVLLGKDAQHPPVAWLVVVKGARVGKTYNIFDDFSIGRDSNCDMVLNDTAISANHAQIRRIEGEFYIYDLASTNGVIVDGEKVYHQKISDGSKISLGESELIFKELNTENKAEDK